METPPPRRPTLAEVAERAGVSRSAASRVINNAQYVSGAKRKAVERAVRELGYVPNPTARALATRKVGAVVLAVSHDDPAALADPFYVQVMVGVSGALEKSEVELMLVLADSQQGQKRLQRVLRSGRTDGVMIVAVRGDDLLSRLGGHTDVPVVYCGRPLGTEPRWYVDADNRGGARLATEHLIKAGRRHVATITGPSDTEVAVVRHSGFREAMAVAGMDPGMAEAGDFSEESGAAAMTRLLARYPHLDGVFAASDNMAAGALRALKAHGRSVPADVAIVGFDDLMIARHTDPALTTVHQPIRQLGHEMARMLLGIIDGEDPSPLILPTRLVVRGSAPAIVD
ncbi:LacI family transcriptional regulator [Micromonospora sp. R77]|uniref:LacI family DNA-binding transcriptional regulator n=1 Tax=Micromonospora sp. R77 TaxID=2925836 RepID=UPI001F60335B|nr:LacI family DNA-binding transcriptional regulator [Micromonospora sp. R77]MCI4066242.1 LacI family transcriptional regulator [Micromonospora sp. R77]